MEQKSLPVGEVGIYGAENAGKSPQEQEKGVVRIANQE